MFAQSTQDQSAKQMFEDMSEDMLRHVGLLNSRLNYVTQNNNLNQQKL
jgi:hypothetical protein